MARPVEFWDKIAERYSKQPIADEEAYRAKLQVTQKYLLPSMKVLEFGCGTGSTALEHAAHVQHIHAIDISGNMINIARQKAASKGVNNVTFESMAIESATVADESFDVVLGLSILHLLENKEATMAKVHRILKPGGLFITSTVCLGDKMKWFKLVGPLGHRLGLIPMVKVFGTQDLLHAFQSEAFKIEHKWQPKSRSAVFIVARKC